MLAFALSILLFAVFFVAGLAILTFCHRQDNLLQNMLIAPAVGLAALVLPVFWLNSIGIPIAQFGVGLAIGVAVATAVYLWRARPKLPWRHYFPFAVAIFAALSITGRPLVEFGFDWMSYSNLDMTGLYSPATQRFLDHGYYAPQDAAFFSGRDYTQSVQGVYVLSGLRSGCELLLAWLLSLTGLTPHQGYMPLGLACHMALVSVTGGMIYQSVALRIPALLTTILIGWSALATLSVLNQLTPQVAGMAVLIATLTVVMQPFQRYSKTGLLKLGGLIGILLAGLFLIYVEFAPFVVLGFAVYAVIQIFKKQFAFKPFLPILIAVILVLLTLNRYLLGRFAHLLLVQAQGSAHDLIPLFPYYLIPSGLAELWGFKSIMGGFPSEVWLAIEIIGGFLLLVIAAVGSLWLLKTGYPAPILTFLMLGVGCALFRTQAAFGLFKLAMIIQPFLIGTMVLVGSRFKPRLLQVLPLLLIGGLGLTTQFGYVEASRGLLNQSGLSEIPYASASHIGTEFKQRVAETTADTVVVDTANISLAWMQALYTRGKVSSFPVFSNFAQSSFKKTSEADTAQAFDMMGGSGSIARNEFESTKPRFETLTEEDKIALITPTQRQGVFNRRSFEPNSLQNFALSAWSQVKDHLIFVPSKLGPHYFPSTHSASFYQLEPDHFYPGQTMAAIGRYFLLRVIHPSETVRLALDLTSSLQADQENKLPPAIAIGTEAEIFPLKGRGSARVFSPPLIPQMIDGLPYLGIDLGREAIAFPTVRKGLMNLYGKDVPIGRKRLVAFGRDISLVSDATYAALSPPSSVQNFPADLRNPNLEYSGIYEDGWVSEAAFLTLAQPAAASQLIIQGVVPQIKDAAFTSELEVRVDGKAIAHQTLKLGEFTLQVEVPAAAQRRRVDLLFSQFQRLPASDGRPAAIQLKKLGFVEAKA